MSALLSDAEIGTLNTARQLLREVERRCHPHANDGGTVWDLYQRGQLDHAVEVAEDAIFDVLNIAHNCLDVPMTDEQLFIHRETRAAS